MERVTTAERLKQYMREHNMRQVDILERIEPYSKKLGITLAKNALSQYISGRNEPRQDKLTLLGIALNVSEVWLMGYDVPEERFDEVATKRRTEEEEKLTDIFFRLSDESREILLAQAEFLLERDRSRKRQESV